MKFLRVKNIERYQPQTNRRLPWIKLMTDLLEPTRQLWYTALPDATKALLHHVWLMAAVHGGRIPEDWLTKERLNLQTKPNLAPLIELGLVWWETETGFILNSKPESKPESEQDSKPDSKRESKQDSIQSLSRAICARSESSNPSGLLSPVEKPDFSQEQAFAALWADYPRRIGRKEAWRHFKASVKTPEDYARCRTALENYKATVEGREMRFVRQGSTWFNSWQDWVDYAEVPASPATPGALQMGAKSRLHLEHIEPWIALHGRRPADAHSRDGWDREFASEWGFTPDEWNEADDDTAAALIDQLHRCFGPCCVQTQRGT